MIKKTSSNSDEDDYQPQAQQFGALGYGTTNGQDDGSPPDSLEYNKNGNSRGYNGGNYP